MQSAYRLRRAPGSESFARAWDAATAAAAHRLVDVAFARAIEGEETPVFDSDGRRIGAKWKGNDRLMMFLLRAYLPDRFRHAHQDLRRPDEAVPPAPPPVAKAIEALTPVTPAQPQLSAPEERMGSMICGARGRAMVYELYPVDEREPYNAPLVEADHAAARARKRQRYRREAARYDEDEDV